MSRTEWALLFLVVAAVLATVVTLSIYMAAAARVDTRGFISGTTPLLTGLTAYKVIMEELDENGQVTGLKYESELHYPR